MKACVNKYHTQIWQQVQRHHFTPSAWYTRHGSNFPRYNSNFPQNEESDKNRKEWMKQRGSQPGINYSPKKFTEKVKSRLLLEGEIVLLTGV